MLVRDVTDLRRRDRELVTKDATIREIHHRVKNNLQTVAALLRLQARRIGSDEARLALEEAVRRVGSIAIVHETLSQEVLDEVAFDEIADRLGAMVTDVGAGPDGAGDRPVVRREGTFGLLPNETATALAMVLTELLQNAVEHGFPSGSAGSIVVEPERLAGRLRVTVDDDGVGLPDGFDPDTSLNLGLSIVRTLVESELGGSAGAASEPVVGGARGGRRTAGRCLTEVGEAVGQAVRTRARELRRFRARRSSSLSPPQTPWSWPASNAHCRHCSRTSQRRHTCLASSIWRMAGPVLPMGKNSSGSSSRQAERSRQSMAFEELTFTRGKRRGARM